MARTLVTILLFGSRTCPIARNIALTDQYSKHFTQHASFAANIPFLQRENIGHVLPVIMNARMTFLH